VLAGFLMVRRTPLSPIFANVIGGKFFAHSRRTLRGDRCNSIGLRVECDLAHSAEVDADVFLFASLLAAVGTLSPKKQLKHLALLTPYDPTDCRLTCAMGR
jgi:hypothetical protein